MANLFLIVAWMLSVPVVLSAEDEVSEADYYAVETFPTDDVAMEVGALARLSDGRIMAGTRTGNVYIIENAYGDPQEAGFKLWASGLAQPLGILELDGWIYMAQRGELTRIKDLDGDDRADVFETVCDEWQISGNYHEYNFGPRLGPDGELWITTNKPFGGEPYGRAHWRGWAVKVNPQTGEMTPVAAGLRSPAGIETSPWGDVFYTDNQGEWCNASKLAHLERGDFHGHPHGLPTKTLAGPPFDQIPAPPSGTHLMKDLHEVVPQFKMPAVWFPYEKMGKSPSGMKWDLTDGGFGPFAGQAFVGDQHHAWVMRVSLEKINGHWQGACYRFREGFQSGVIRLAFGKDASMFVGMSNAGWGGRGNRPWGLQRVRWTGETPFEIHSMSARPDGFELKFTLPVDVESAEALGNYHLESYTYRLRSAYGGPEEDKQEVAIDSVRISGDGTRVRLFTKGLRAGYVHELILKEFKSKDGVGLLHTEAYYTLVEIPGA